jgi:hypothetical protein
MNLINAFFWPFLIRYCVSMRLINEVGPVPSKTGRYIGRSPSRAEGTSVVCADARSTIENKTNNESANARMGKYASGERGFFKRNLGKDFTRQSPAESR